MSDVADLSELLGESGCFAQHVENFQVRIQQVEMAKCVQSALLDGHDLLAEAGTGTGKTFAYLAPAILSGQKVLISTGTKNLQDQLFYRDFPVVRDALKVPVSAALLKGRSNYLCLDRLEDARSQQSLFSSHETIQIHDLTKWSLQTSSGDIAEFDGLSERDPFWPTVTSTRDNCLGQDCDYFKDCFVMDARRRAQAADIVIVNHHLLLSDLVLKEEGHGEILPEADCYIIDEAHQLPDIASNYFGEGFSTQQFIELANDTKSIYAAEINEQVEFKEQCDRLALTAQSIRRLFGDQQMRSSWNVKTADKTIVSALTSLHQDTIDLIEQLDLLCERSKELELCKKRAVNLGSKISNVALNEQGEHIHWFETHRRSLTMHMTPLDISAAFQELKKNKHGHWIFTSATLTVANRFDHYSNSLGLTGFEKRSWGSPFDYKKQALMFMPEKLLEPNSSEHTQMVVDYALSILEYSRGGMFVLFTSYRALKQAKEILSDETDRPLFVQGDAPRDVLLQRFSEQGNAILLGTSSFWEGVDVRGSALSCVIIDKLPFAAPNDPVLQARLELIRKQGQNPFMEYQLPSAVITLKQGVGRLIRDVNDFGVLLVCDPRLKTKAYGRTFISSLPNFPITDKFSDIISFFKEKYAAEDGCS